MRGRDLLRGITPPYLVDAVRHARPRPRSTQSWEYVGTEWIHDTSAGWNAATVAERYERKLPVFRAAIAAPNCIGVPTEAVLGCAANQYDQNIALGYAYAVARAAAGRDRVSILDWGGGFGFMALIARELFPELEIEFHVKEVPHTARVAEAHVDGVTFWDDDSCLGRAYDLVSACCSLQYSPDWRAQLGRLGGAGRFLVLTRTPISLTPRSYVVRQYAYETSYVGWVISRDELLTAADAGGLALERELLEGWSAEVPGAPARDEHRAYLFRIERDVRIFTMGDARFFLGAVALVNSLRIVGHEEPITFLDLGLERRQRELLGQECDVIDVDRVSGDHPWLYQPYARLVDPSGVCVILDSDVIVTSPLASLVDAARQGAIAAYADVYPDRFFPEWERLFALRAPLRRGRVYVNSGLLAFSADTHGDFLERWWQLCRGLVQNSDWRSGDSMRWPDQDTLNALLMSEFADDARVLDDVVPMGTPEMAGVEVLDLARLECRYLGAPVTALHAITMPKPWWRAARSRLTRTAYLDCLRRLLVGDDIRIVVEERSLPVWLRSGPRATLAASALHIAARVPDPVHDWAYRAKWRVLRQWSTKERRTDAGPEDADWMH